MFIEDIDENALYVTWINDILLQSKYNGNVNSMKKELADVLTKSAISTLGDKWSDSYIRKFLNQLRKHVSGEEFTQPWTNSVLSSIAAVITKGDDWESLLYFMQQKGMTDYRLAFSFYGILNGFANLTRDFTDELFSQDRKYIANVYREFYGQLHGVSINIGSQFKYEANESIYDSNNSKELLKPTLSSLFVEQEGQADSDKIFEEIWIFFGSSAFKNMRKKEELAKGLRMCLENNIGVSDITHIIFDLNKYVDYGWSKSNKPWKTMQEHFCHFNNDSINQKGTRIRNSYKTPSLFNYPVIDANNILSNLWNDIERLIPDSSKAKVREDVEWFVKTMCNPTEKQKYYSNVDINDTKDIIERLIKLKSGRGKDGKQKAPYFPDELRSKVRDFLYKKYGIR